MKETNLPADRRNAPETSRNYANLGEFVALLETRGELIRIGEPCSPELEIAAITDLASKSPGGGKALLFEKVADSSFPVLTNAFGSVNRIALALGGEQPDDLRRRLKAIVELKPPQGVAEKLSFLREAVGWSRFIPRTVKKAPCQEVVYQGAAVDLRRLPVLKTWPLDGGPFVTLPVVFTRSLLTGRRNAGMYRMQIYDANTAGMHWHIHKDGAHFFHEYRQAGKRMEAAVAIGTDPAVTYAATAPLPRGIDEMLLAGFIRKAPVAMTKCLTVDLEVPAEAEIVLEGYLDPEELRLEGPFGDHTGYYSLPDLYPVFHVTAVTHRRKAIYSATVVGRPPMEDCYLGLATERIFLPLLQTIQPEIKDYRLPWEGVFHNLVLVAIDKTYPRQALKVMQALWGSGQMSFCKTIVVLDDSVDLKNQQAVWRLLTETLDFERDLLVTEGILDALDHAAPEACYGGKLGIDLTAPYLGESVRTSQRPSTAPDEDDWNKRLRHKSDRFAGLRIMFPEAAHPLFLLSVRKEGEAIMAGLGRLFLALGPPVGTVAVFFDATGKEETESALLWRVLTNTDPRRDLIREGGVLLIDATQKGPEDGFHRPWPEELTMDGKIEKAAKEKAVRWGII